MKKQTKKKIIIGILVGLMICSGLFFFPQNAFGIANDKDTQATLHCELNTDSSELTGSNLMTSGTHSFWETPELDIGTFSYDSTRIDVTNIQKPTYNITTPKSYNKNDGLTGNFTVNTTKIDQYSLSAPFDSVININISFSREVTGWVYSGDSYDFVSDNVQALYCDGTYFYILVHKTSGLDRYKIYKYDSDWNYVSSSSDRYVGSEIGVTGAIVRAGSYAYVLHSGQVDKYSYDLSTYYGNIGHLKIGAGMFDIGYYSEGGAYDGTYYWMVESDTDTVYQYNSYTATGYTGVSYYVGTQDTHPTDMYYDGTYFWILGKNTQKVYCYDSSWSYTGVNYSITEDSKPTGLYHNGSFYWISGNTNDKSFKYGGNELFDNVYVNNFSYEKLGIPYHENYTLVYDSSRSNFSILSSSGWVSYYFDSTMFSQYDHTNDLTILEQNLSLTLDLNSENEVVNMTFVVSYSTCEWKVPTEVALTINGEEVIDNTYNSGWVSLSTYTTSLIITATDTVFFRLNITIDFSFTFSLTVISKTYLKKSFELKSDHEIEIERINFDSDLNIKKIYLNNIDLGSSNPNFLSPTETMDTGNIFVLEILLVEEIYLPLQYLYNHLGSGTSNIYMSGISNTLTYSNINGNQLYSIVLPTGWKSEYGQLTFSNIDYLPDYIPNYSNDESGYSYGSSSYGNENVSWGQRYYETNGNGSFLEDSGGSGYENVYSEYFNALNGYMSHNYGGLDGYNSTYTVNDYLYMQNMFPTELNYEDWLSWVHNYNNEYSSSSFYNIFSSVLDSYNIGALGSNDNPIGVAWNGTHFFVTDTDTFVYVYDSDFSSLLDFYDIGALGNDQPYGITWDGNYFYVVDLDDRSVYMYPSDFSSLITSYNLLVLGGNQHPRGIAWDGTNFFVTDPVDVFVYDSDFSSLITSYDIGALGENDDPWAITCKDSYFYVVDNNDAMMYKYPSSVILTSVLNTGSDSTVPSNSSFSFTKDCGKLLQNGSLWDIDGDYSINQADKNIPAETLVASYNLSALGDNDSPRGITWNGTNFFVTDWTDGFVYMYPSDFSSILHCYNLSALGDNDRPRGITWNGTNFFVTDYNTLSDGFVYVYPSDFSSVITNYNLSALGNENPKGITWNGTNFFVNDKDDSVYVYPSDFSSLITAYNLNVIGGKDVTLHGITWDGTKFLVVDWKNDFVYVYPSDFSSPLDCYNLSLLGQDNLYGIEWDGIYFYIIDQTVENAHVYKYDFSLITTELDFNSVFNLNPTGMQSNDTIDSIRLYYSHKTNVSVEISFEIWNYDLSRRDIVNCSTNKDNFYDLYFILNSSYYQEGTYAIRLYWFGNDTVDFELYIDKLLVQVDWTKTSGEIYATVNKDIDFVFLDRYEGYGDYQKLYNVTIEFQYRFNEYINWSNDLSWYFYGSPDSFNDEEVGDKASLDEIDWVDGHTLHNGEAEIITEWKGHNNVLRLLDDSDEGEDPMIYHSLTQSTSGIIEFWIGTNDVTKDWRITLYESGFQSIIILRISASKLQYKDKYGAYQDIQTVANDRWYHIRIDWYIENNFDVYVDEVLKVNRVSNFQHQGSGIDRIYFVGHGDSTDYLYIDAVGEPSDSNYNVGDNVDPLPIYFQNERINKTIEWTHFSYNFEFDSASTDHFTLLFNITNGLLEIDSNFNYTIFFKCLDTSGYNRIYQYFKYDPPNLNLDYLQKTRGNWILNFTYSFDPSTDAGIYNFYNSINHSLLYFNVSIEHEDGWTSVVYNYNTTQSNIDFTLNITSILDGLGKNRFLDFYIEFYLSGNPSNFTLDNLTLFDFDSDFYEVQALWITDTLVISYQPLVVYWKAVDRYIEHIEIHQKYLEDVNLIHNTTLFNDTLQSFGFYSNISAGFYELNLTFFDNYSNWEKWTLNFTIINSISISTAYKNPIFINEINTISVHIDTEYSIMDVFYDNSTNYIHEYANSSYPLYVYEFNFTLSYSVETVYNISILVIGEYNDSFWCNISFLSVIERTTMLDINNLHYSYYQDEIMNVSFALRDLYNNPISNKLINYTIENPDGNIIVNGSGTTNIYGNVTYSLSFNISYTIGFYHLNVSFNGTKDYISVWKLQSFQVRPISRTVNCTDINLKVNNFPVSNNYIQVNWTNNFTFTNYNSSTFDMEISLKLNYTENIIYSEYLYYTYKFSATIDISSLRFDTANITNYPNNFTDYYYNDLGSTNYNIENATFQVLDLIGEKFYNNEEFSILFTYWGGSQVNRIQLTDEPRTDTNTVQFREHLTANRTFSYWYFHNSLNISTVSLYHNRTGSTISNSSFTIENNNYYFKKSCSSGDVFTATMTYWVDWDNYVSYEVLTKNGTYCEVKITYQGPFAINNVTIVLDLNAENLYAENWSHNGVQSLYTFILEIPHINFTTSQQTMTITGVSSIPYCTFRSFANEEDYEFSKGNYDDDNNKVWYRGYLKFPYYSQAFIIKGRNTTWTLDGVHYSGDEYDITNTGYFECSGYGSGISSAYLRFKTHPIGEIARHVNYKYDYTEVVYRINTILEIQDAEFEFYIENDKPYTIIDIFFEGDEVDHDEYKKVKLTKIDGKDYYLLLDLDFERGVNKIHILYREEKLENNALQLILVVVALGFLGICLWRTQVVLKITKEAKERKEKLKRADIVFLFLFMPNRISNEKVKRRLEKRKKKGKPKQRSWEELKEEARKLKEEARKLKLKKVKEKLIKKKAKKKKRR